MIRRFFNILVFIGTILTASFGQNIVGRDMIRSWAEEFQKSAPMRGRIALKQTDVMLAQLVPQAGTQENKSCSFLHPQ